MTQSTVDIDALPHPRVCGENYLALEAASLTRGSSPRVRGKRDKTHVHTVCCRLIPACAGKTTDNYAAAISSQAHPRVCGENPRLSRILRAGQGSSPRVRGKRISER